MSEEYKKKIEKLKQELLIMKTLNIKPNYSELSRIYKLDRRTIEKYNNGYSKSEIKRNRKSKLDKYYDEIKLYFLHTYLYETLYFAKLRNFEISLSFFNELRQTIITEVPDYKSSPYADIIPLQMKLYNKLEDDINIKWLTDYIETI